MKNGIFSTGVYLEEVECVINGCKQWRWVATRFEDDSYNRNGELVNPFEYSDSHDGLIENFEND